MRLTGFLVNGVRHIGELNETSVRDLGTATDFYVDPDGAMASTSGAAYQLEDVRLAPAVPETSRIFCVGINYRSHAAESRVLAGLDEPEVPMIFGRWQQSLVLDGDLVPLPPNEPGLDWEVELAAIIKTPIWRANQHTAMDHVLGYATFNDLSARTKQLQTAQFTLGKNADRSGPMSPIVTRDDAGDPKRGLRVTTHVNGVLRQDGNTKDLIHDVGQIIAHITDTITLLPGDIIATGTPGGVGAGMNPPLFLQDGDEVVVEVESVGRVANTIVSRDALDNAMKETSK